MSKTQQANIVKCAQSTLRVFILCAVKRERVRVREIESYNREQEKSRSLTIYAFNVLVQLRVTTVMINVFIVLRDVMTNGGYIPQRHQFQA